MYGREVPAYETLVEVTREINAEVVGRDGGDAERLGSIGRVSAERHGAIRVGTPRELAQAARVFAAFGMHPVGFYDLRDAGAGCGAGGIDGVPPARRGRAGPQPVPGLHLDAGRRRPRATSTPTPRPGCRRSWPPGCCSRPSCSTLADRAAAEGGLPDATRTAAAPRDGRVRAVVDPVDRAWYDHLERISAVAADIGGVPTTHLNHLTPRVLDIDELYGADAVARHRDDRRDPGSARVGGPGRAAAADVVPRARRGPGVPVPRRVGAHRRVAGAVRGGRAARDRADAAGARALRPDGRRGRRARRWTRRRPGGVAAAPAGDRTRVGGAGLAFFTYRVPGRTGGPSRVGAECQEGHLHDARRHEGGLPDTRAATSSCASWSTPGSSCPSRSSTRTSCRGPPPASSGPTSPARAPATRAAPPAEYDLARLAGRARRDRARPHRSLRRAAGRLAARRRTARSACGSSDDHPSDDP